MPKFNHYQSVSSLLSEPEWLNVITWDIATYAHGEITLTYESGVVVRLISDDDSLRLGGNSEPTQGTVNAIEIGTSDGSVTYESITDLNLSLTSLYAEFPKAADLVLDGTLEHRIFNAGTEVLDHYGGAASWDAETTGADSPLLFLTVNSVQTVHGTYLYEDRISLRFDSDGGFNSTPATILLRNYQQSINTFEVVYQGSVSTDINGISTEMLTLYGVNHADGGNGDDFIEGRAWYGITTFTDGSGSVFDGRSGSTLRGNGGDDILLNGLISYGGDGNDLIVLADYGEFVSPNGDAEFRSFAYGGADDDTFILPAYAGMAAGVDAPLLAMTIDGGSGIDTLAFSDPRLGDYGGYATEHTFQISADLGIAGNGSLSFLNGTGVIAAEFTSIENLSTGGGSDFINGSNNNNILNGMDGEDLIQARGGDDVVIGGAHGDQMSGGDGIDTLSYETSASGVTVDLGLQTFSGGDAQGDQLIAADFENLRGSEHDDTLTGDGFANVISGLGGNNTLNGMGGADTLIGGELDDVLNGGDGDDILDSGNAYYGTAIFSPPVIDGNEGNLSGKPYDLNQWVKLDVSAGQTVPRADLDVTSGPGNASQFFEFDTDGTTTNLVLGIGSASGQFLKIIVTDPDNVTWESLATGGGTGAHLTFTTPLEGRYTIEVLGSNGDPVATNTSYDFFAVAEGYQPELVRGTDTLNGNGGNDTLNGGDGIDILNGGNGDDTLDGGINADRMVGGQGNDTYHVDNAGDTTVEVAGEGTDSVISSISFGLWSQNQFLENLVLSGGGNIDGTGNALANTLTGNAGNNVLNGGVGADRMVGGLGNDTYHVDNTGDTTIELSGEGTDTVISSVSYLLWNQSQHIENLTLIGGGNIDGGGNALANTLAGNAGNNVLNGGVGADRMVGGAGNDSYYVDNAGDTTIETSGQGIDSVFSSVSYLLWNQSQHIENLTLIGAGNIDGVGNSLANTITGNAGNNMLNGGGGADRMVGGAGNDTYHVDNAGDTTVEVAGEGTDTVISSVNFELWTQSQHIENLTLIGGGNLNGVGNALANTLTGNAGNNVLNGGVGADRMVGGDGNDTYHVDNAGDTTIEVAGQGTDNVISSVSYFLWNQSQHIENLTLIGSGNIDGGGNGLANTLTGNAGNNVLNGGGGADRMVGGEGNDTYYVDNFGDTTIELAGEGTDLVRTSVGFALRDQSQHIENLTLIGTGHIYGTGNGLANTITGNSGNNGLNGAWGDDTLIGGAGNDTFRDDAGNDIFTGGTGADTFFFLSAGESDRITDFEDGIDTMTIGLGVNSFANITVTDSGADTILTFGSNTVTLENFDHTLVSSDDFTFV